MENVTASANHVSESSEKLRLMTERFKVERNEIQKISTKEI
jgi:hypothetical protein